MTNKKITIIPNDTFEISDVIVDGVSQGPLNEYTFTNIKKNHTLHAIFQKSILPSIWISTESMINYQRTISKISETGDVIFTSSITPYYNYYEVPIEFDSNGNVIVVGNSNGRPVTKLSQNGEIIWENNNWSTDSYPSLYDLTVDNDDSIIISCNDEWSKVDSDGNLIWNIVLDGSLGYRYYLSTDSDNNIYVADQYWGCMRKFNTNGEIQWTVNDPDEDYNNGGITTDLFGNIYMTTNRNSNVMKVDSEGNFIWKKYGLGDYSASPFNIESTPNGNLVVNNDPYITVYDPDGNLVWNWEILIDLKKFKLDSDGNIILISNDEIFKLDYNTGNLIGSVEYNIDYSNLIGFNVFGSPNIPLT